MSANYEDLDVQASLGTLLVYFMKDGTTDWIEMGFTHSDSPFVLSIEEESVEHQVTLFGNQTVQSLLLGSNITLEGEVVFDKDLIPKLSNSYIKTKTGLFLDAATAGKSATLGVMRLHPINRAGNDYVDDIYILGALVKVGANIESGAEGKQKAPILVNGKPRSQDMRTIPTADVTVTAVDGGALTDATTYGYRIAGATNTGFATPSVSVTGLTATPNLTLDVKFSRVLGATFYRLWRTLDAGTTWSHLDVNESGLTVSDDLTELTYVDDGSETWVVGIPVEDNTAKSYVSVKFDTANEGPTAIVIV